MIDQHKGLTSPDGITYRLVPLEWIIPNPENYNQHPREQIEALKADFKRFGQVKPYVVKQQDETTFMLSAGEGCTIAAGELLQEDSKKYENLGWAKIVVVPDWWTDADVIGFMAADNETGRMSIPDEERLIRILQRQKEAGYDLRSLGSDEEALRQMLANHEEENGTQELPDGDESVPLPEEEQTRVKPGDIWQLGRHRIGCLNALDESDVQRLLSGCVPTFIFSDPPYGLDIVATNVSVGGGEAYDIPFGGVKKHKGDVGGGASHMRKTGKPYIAEQGLRGSDGASKPFGTVGRIAYGMKAKPIIEAGKYAPVIGDDSPTTAITAYCLYAELFPKAVHVWWGGNHYAHALPPSSCWIVWDKENNESFFADCELAWTNQKTAVRIFRHMWNGLMKDSERSERRVHPTQKPVALAQWCFEKYGKENDLIYDPFLGSGISVIAGERLERTVYGCELSPAYIDVIIKRWEKETTQQAQLVERLEVAS